MWQKLACVVSVPLLAVSLVGCGNSGGKAGEGHHFQRINAVTLATSNMEMSIAFYKALGLNCTYGSAEAGFATFGSSGGPFGGDNSFHINILKNETYQRPSGGAWNGWGRAILYVNHVNDVDAVYKEILKQGLHPEAPPANADWGERYFQILDPMGHELSIAKPLVHLSVQPFATAEKATLAHRFQSINAVTLATSDMNLSYAFYKALGLNCTFGSPKAEFATFGSSGGPSGGDNSFHINILTNETYRRPSGGAWNGWGRAILYVNDVDAVYRDILTQGLQPEAPPANASWGERYFQILDPMGHELSIAKPLLKATAQSSQKVSGASSEIIQV